MIFNIFVHDKVLFLATLVALHFTPVSESVSGSAEFRTSVASRLASLLILNSDFFKYENWHKFPKALSLVPTVCQN